MNIGIGGDDDSLFFFCFCNHMYGTIHDHIFETEYDFYFFVIKIIAMATA